jgi:hypothetical protein
MLQRNICNKCKIGTKGKKYLLLKKKNNRGFKKGPQRPVCARIDLQLMALLGGGGPFRKWGLMEGS